MRLQCFEQILYLADVHLVDAQFLLLLILSLLNHVLLDADAHLLPIDHEADAKTWKEGKKYLQVSTDEVYGALGAEGFFMETTPLCPHSPYSSSKASADMFVMAFHDTYGMPINITRCSNNYGPYQFPEKLIPLMINNVKHHKQLPVYGDGMQIRDWLPRNWVCAQPSISMQRLSRSSRTLPYRSL